MAESEKAPKKHEKKESAPAPLRPPTLSWEGPPALVVVGGAGLTIGSRLNLKRGSNVLGRAPDVDIPVMDSSMSRRHVDLILAENGQVTARDLGSRHGTLINDHRTDALVLQDGDYLRCGNLILKFRTTKTGNS
jgi:pSer/pThr/pTyr-binding forkhead associated (FHA) protein